ncbi:MAG: FadR family transcriptional regulator [Betaproteobacteria bacterium]|nr:FadR family transcriptional regulator [Betaproteobacteria bacterium]
MPFQSIEPRRLYRQIADQIRTLIGSGEFPAGSRLPSERDLAKQLGVSRPSVREALIALEVEGLVEVRIGSGIYALEQAGKSVAATADAAEPVEAEAGPFELLRARYVIESECAALAAKTARKPQVQAIEAALDEMQGEMQGAQPPLGGDRLFHLRIAEATGNGALVAVVKMLWEERTGPLYQQLEEHYDSPALWNAALAEHRAVLKAIAARDSAAARAAMQRHLNHAYKRFNTGWDNLK